MIPQEMVTLIVAGFGIAGTFGGVVVGQRMSQSWQREQWIRDQQVVELRELLTAIADSYRAAMMMYAGAVLGPDPQREIVETHSNAMRVIRSRIFVIDFVIDAKIEIRWSEAIREHQKSMDIPNLASAFSDIQRDIVIAAGGTKMLHHNASRV